MAWPINIQTAVGGALRDLVTQEIMQTIAGILNYITVEEIEGLDHAYIEKTAVPSAEHPWRILIPLGSTYAVLSDTAPVEAGTAAAGDGAAASRDNHVHPARVDSPGSQIEIAASGTAAAQSTTWVVGNSGKHPVKVWRHRYYYDGTTGSERIVGVQHYEIHEAVTGALLEVGAESTYTVTSPEFAQ